MKKELDIHNYGRKIEVELLGLQRSAISDRNKVLICDFKDELIRRNLSLPRILKYVNNLKLTALWFSKDFELLSKADIERFVSYLHSRQDYSQHTIQAYKVMIKKMVHWIKGSVEVPPEVSWIKINFPKSKSHLPSEGDLLTEEEIKKLIDAAGTVRDKAFISVLAESGCRIGEVGTLRISGCEFDKLGVVMCVKGKTGARRIRIIASVPYLVNWINCHPSKNDRDAPLWASFGNKKGEQVCYNAFKKVIKNAAKKAGITKRTNPHSFRHSRATLMAKHLTEFQMNKYFGWIQGSDMPSTYVHLSGRDLDDSILSFNGIKVEKKVEESVLKPLVCSKCDTINTSDSKYCSKCANILDLKTVMELELKAERKEQINNKTNELIASLLKDPEIRTVLLSKIHDMGIKKSMLDL